jgi:hypothetical protein
MANKINYAGNLCSSGVSVPFSGISLALNNTYRINFSCVSTISPNSQVILNPTGYNLTPSETKLTLQTNLLVNNGYNLDNSSSNIVKLSIFNSSNTEIYRDYVAVTCGDLCGSSGVPSPTVTPTITPSVSSTPPSPSPTVTPTVTSTLTPTPTPTRTQALPFYVAFDNYVTQLDSCSKVVVGAKVYGLLNQLYQYNFSTDMTGTDFYMSNPSGTILLTSNPTYVYTAISLPLPCLNYSLKFGVTNANHTVQTVGFFRCGNCP